MRIINDGKALVNIFRISDRKTQDLFPLLLEKLIKASCNKNTYTCFPSGSAIFTPGFDGVVENAPKGFTYVPSGRSVWEAGSNAISLTKVKNDYEKRKNNKFITQKRKTSFVLVSSSILDQTKKLEKIKSFNKDKVFKKVIILDANDLANWLSEHLEISIWLLREFGADIKEYGIKSINDEWLRIARSTVVELPLSIFVCGNESESTKFIEDIKTSDFGVYSFSSSFYGKQHAYYFIISSLLRTKDYSLLDRCIIVENTDAFMTVNACCENKILILNFDSSKIEFQNVSKNTIIIPDNPLPTTQGLKFTDRGKFRDILKSTNLSGDEADKYSHLSNCNPVSLMRLLSKLPTDKTPAWSRLKDKYELIPLMLLGEINMNKQMTIDILKQVVTRDVDEFIYSLNFLSELDDPPLFKYNGIYMLGSRFETFDFVQIDIFLNVIDKVETLLIKLIFETNYSHDIHRLVDNIVKGLILIAIKDEKNQNHFDIFVSNVFNNIHNKVEEAEKIGPFLRILTELSPNSFLDYLTKTMAENSKFLTDYSKTTHKGFVENENSKYILSALSICLLDKDLATNALNCLLDYFFIIDSSKAVERTIEEILSPIASISGTVAIPYSKKIDFFFKYIANNDKNNTAIEPIVKNIATNGNDSIAITGNDYYRSFKTEKYECTFSDMFESQELAFNWLLLNAKDKKEFFDDVFQNIHNYPFDQMEREFNEIIKSVDALSSDDKEDIRIKAITTKGNIIRFDNWEHLSVYIPVLERLIVALEPNDLYEKYNYILRNDFFPLENPPKFESEDHFEAEQSMRNSIRKDVFSKLFGRYGQNLIQKIISDDKAVSYYIWGYIFNSSDNVLRDIENLIKTGHEKGLKYYLGSLDDKVVKTIFEKHAADDLIYKCLPFNELAFRLINGQEKERLFWESNHFYRNTNVNLSSVFDKYLLFAPTNIAAELAFYNELEYETGLKYLKRIAEIINNENYKRQLRSVLYEIQEIVKKMDASYYSNDLAICEFKLLPILMGNIGDYPLGIKKYFWNNPNEFAELLLSIFKAGNSLEKNSIGFRIYMDSLITVSDSCFIPKEYISQQPSEFKKWADVLISKCDFVNNEKGSHFIVRAIINVCSACQRFPGQLYWPTIEVADILEELATKLNNDRNEIASVFACDVSNRRGIRTIKDGNPEFVLRDEYLKCADFYKFTHNITYRALKMIASDYGSQGKNDKIRFDLGIY